MCICGHILGGCTAINMVDKVLSVLWLCRSGGVSWMEGTSFSLSSIGVELAEEFVEAWIAGVERRGQQHGNEVECVWEDDHEKKWEFLRTILLASSQNGMRNSQLVHYTQDEYFCEQLQVAWDSNHPAICTQSVQCWLFIDRDICMWTADIRKYWIHINSTFFDRKDVCWYFSEDIPEILLETDAQHHVMLYSEHCYSECSDSQNADFAAFKSIRHTNLDIEAACCLHAAHISQHPTSSSSRMSTQNTIVNAPKKNISPLIASNYGKTTNHTTLQHHQANDGKCNLEGEMVWVFGA